MSIRELLMLSGWLTFLSLIITAVTGIMIFKFHVKWVTIKLHTALAIITLILAIIHVAVVLYTHI